MVAETIAKVHTYLVVEVAAAVGECWAVGEEEVVTWHLFHAGTHCARQTHAIDRGHDQVGLAATVVLSANDADQSVESQC
jgi:hypothetical protein